LRILVSKTVTVANCVCQFAYSESGQGSWGVGTVGLPVIGFG
jgi:hypothetical protein